MQSILILFCDALIHVLLAPIKIFPLLQRTTYPVYPKKQKKSFMHDAKTELLAETEQHQK